MYRIKNDRVEWIIYDGELQDFVWESTKDEDVINYLNELDNITIPGLGSVPIGQVYYALCKEYDEYDWSRFFEEYVDWMVEYIEEETRDGEVARWQDFIIQYITD